MPPKPPALRRVVASLLVVLSACSSDGDFDGLLSSTTSSSRPTSSSSTSTTHRPQGATVPSWALVADGVSFGTAPPPLEAALDALQPDEFLREAVAAVAYDTESTARIADVLVIALNEEAFEGADSLTAYMDALEAGLPGEGESIETFRFKELVVALLGTEEEKLAPLAAGMQTAIGNGQRGTGERFTPMQKVLAASVFVEMKTARFAPFGESAGPPTPEGSPTTEPPPAAPAVPVLGGGGAVKAEPRQVIVAGEVRATAWALATSLDSFMRAEDLEPQIAALVTSRAGKPSATYVRDRKVWGADPTDGRVSVRAFRHQNIVVVVEGADAVQLDALVVEWIAAL